MDITIDCKISLSKKLRKAIEGTGQIVLSVDNVTGGVGEGRLYIKDERESTETIMVDDPTLFEGETAIQITPLKFSEDIPSGPAVTSIFTNNAESIPEPPQSKSIAVLQAPEPEAVSTALQPEPEVPQAFQEMKDPECLEYVRNTSELLDAINQAKIKKAEPVDLSTCTTEREKLIALEQMERSEAIEVPAFIVNDSLGMMTINDIGVDLKMNVPFNLANISAKKLSMSTQLRAMIKAGYVKFISPQQADEILNEYSSDTPAGLELEVFGSAEEAANAMGTDRSRTPLIDDYNSVEISEDDLDAPTDVEEIINLTGMPTTKSPGDVDMVDIGTGEVRMSSHGTAVVSSPRPAPSGGSGGLSGDGGGAPTIKRVG